MYRSQVVVVVVVVVVVGVVVVVVAAAAAVVVVVVVVVVDVAAAADSSRSRHSTEGHQARYHTTNYRRDAPWLSESPGLCRLAGGARPPLRYCRRS